MELLENQPIIFEEAVNDCVCAGLDYTQLVDLSDTNQFQIKLEPCTDANNLVLNGAFNDATSWNAINFSIASNQACANGGINATIYQNNVFDAGKYYKLTITVDSGTDIDLNVQFGNGNTVKNITAIGTYDIYGFAVSDGGGLGDSLIFVSVAPATVCISNVSVFEVQTNFGFAIKDKNGYIVYSDWLDNYIYPFVTGTTVTSYDVQSDYFTLVDGYVTVSVNWGDFEIQTKGCYTICLLDPCVNTQFSIPVCDADQWAYSDFGVSAVYWDSNISDIKECYIQYVGEGDGSFAIVNDDYFFDLVLGTKYVIKFTLNSVINTEVTIRIDDADSAVYNADGTYEVEMVADGTGGFAIRFEAKDAGVCQAEVSDIHIHVANSLLQTTICSNTLKLGDYSCTQLINACNDTDAFGMLFVGTGFSPSIRLDSQLDRLQFKFERLTETNSVARIRNTYYQRTKNKRLMIQPVAEYVHLFLSLLAGFDHFYIDGVEYVVSEDEEYVVNYDGSDYVGSVSFNVTQKEDLVRNAVTDAEGEGCNNSASQEGLVDEATGLFLLTAEDDSDNLIEENQ